MNDSSHPVAARLLLKGLEEEVYTGDASGHVVGLSHKIAAEMQGFATEPDSRNVEYITAPYREYQILIDRLMAKRCALRRYLDGLDGYTLVPGSVIPLDPAEEFHISNAENPYYRYIRDTYGTRVVTASTHINIGIEEPEQLIRAYRVLRMEASMFLALTAASPFRGGEVTGYHSTRWHMFPETPQSVPLFASHDEFKAWMPKQIEAGAMQNSRHLWISVRPNGEGTPVNLNRLELRICDRISNPRFLRAVVALYEARVQQVLADEAIDPLRLNLGSERLLELLHENEAAAARSSLEASVVSWRDGRTQPMVEWIEQTLDDVADTASRLGLESEMETIRERLESGNLAQKWLRQVSEGRTPAEVIRIAIQELAEIDRQYDPDCPSP